MQLNKEQVAKILEEMAALMELTGQNSFKVRAYVHAARTLYNLKEDFEQLINEDRLIECEGIGEALDLKIKMLAKTGTHPFYEELKKSIPVGLSDLMRIPGLGQKKIQVLYQQLGIDSVEALKQACLSGTLEKVRGFGSKTTASILEGITHLEAYVQRHLWWSAMQIAAPLLEELRHVPGVQQAAIAGSLRRRLETIGDIDFVVAADESESIMEWFTSHPSVERILAHGQAKSSVRLYRGFQVDLRIVPEKQFAFTLCYSTGSKEHGVKLRQIAHTKGLSLSEWGLVDQESKAHFIKPKKTLTEADIYKALELDFIPPELREDRGEIEAAQKKALPHLIEEKDIRGIFHVHTSASDGKESLEAMVQGAQHLGWEYVGISDHSKSSFQANGLSAERLWDQIQHIRQLNKAQTFKPYIFAGLECDILPDGSLDFDHEVLKELDFVIVSVHSAFKQDEASMTKRLIRAIENPDTTMIGHVSGRLLLRREPYAFNVEKIIDACIANGKIMELNAQPLRLDMDWRHWHKAAEKGLMCCINPDAHSQHDFQYMQAGIQVARKGWLEKHQVLNTYSLAQLKKILTSSQS
jgi:DNA polymerase (family 10)